MTFNWQKPPDRMTQAELEELMIQHPGILNNFVNNTLQKMTLLREKRERIQYCFRLCFTSLQRRDEQIRRLQDALRELAPEHPLLPAIQPVKQDEEAT